MIPNAVPEQQFSGKYTSTYKGGRTYICKAVWTPKIPCGPEELFDRASIVDVLQILDYVWNHSVWGISEPGRVDLNKSRTELGAKLCSIVLRICIYTGYLTTEKYIH